VVLTDVVQFVVLVFASLIMVPLSLQAAGGLSAMQDALPDHFTFFHGPKGDLLFLLAYYLMVLIKYNGNWSFIQRFYSVRDEAAGCKMGLLMAALFFVFPFVFLLPAIAARIVVPDLADHELAYVSMAMRVLPAGVMGLMLAAMFAATMSALDSEFNVTASVFTRDIYQRLLRPAASPSELMWVARGATVAVGNPGHLRGAVGQRFWRSVRGEQGADGAGDPAVRAAGAGHFDARGAALGSGGHGGHRGRVGDLSELSSGSQLAGGYAVGDRGVAWAR
jgi:hypothetical protein